LEIESKLLLTRADHCGPSIPLDIEGSFRPSLLGIMKHGGDDLEDDFVLDEIVALSGDEAPGAAQLDDEDIFIDDDGQTPEEEDDTDEVGLAAPTSHSRDLTASAKKRKRREKEKERKVRPSDVWRLLCH
jgi:hypothetical protein